MERAVICIVNDSDQAELAVEQLRDAGFEEDSISVREPEETLPSNSGRGLPGMGWFVGIGSLAFLGLGPFVSGGPTFAVLSAAVVGAAFGGLAVSGLAYGAPEYAVIGDLDRGAPSTLLRRK